MTSPDESVEKRLERLTAATANTTPRREFVLRVMAQVEVDVEVDVRTKLRLTQPSEDDWSRQVLRWARMGMAVATMAAAAGVVLAWSSSASADQEEALSYGIVEAFE